MADQVFKVVNKLPPDGATYDVVCTENRYSACTLPPYMLIYRKGKTTKPEIGCIFAYNDYFDAVRFIANQMIAHAEIWLADATVVNWAPDEIGRIFTVRDFWEGYGPVYSPPRGTIWCSELTPTRMVAYAVLKGTHIDVVSTWPLV